MSVLSPALQKVFLAQLFKAECLSNYQLPAYGSINTKGEASKIGMKKGDLSSEQQKPFNFS